MVCKFSCNSVWKIWNNLKNIVTESTERKVTSIFKFNWQKYILIRLSKRISFLCQDVIWIMKNTRLNMPQFVYLQKTSAYSVWSEIWQMDSKQILILFWVLDINYLRSAYWNQKKLVRIFSKMRKILLDIWIDWSGGARKHIKLSGKGTHFNIDEMRHDFAQILIN